MAKDVQAQRSGSCREHKPFLNGFADGELDAVNVPAAAAHLQDCIDCTTYLNEIIRQKALLARNAVRFRAPATLRGRVADAIAFAQATETGATQSTTLLFPPEQRPKARHSINWAGTRWPRANTAFSAMALAASLMLVVSAWDRSPGLDEQLVSAHIRSLQVSHLTDVTSTNQHTVKPWFLGKLDFSPPVVDLAKDDFPLIGGRLDFLGGHAIPALVYKRNGHIINLFVWPAGKLKATSETEDGFNVLVSTRGGFDYIAVSDLNSSELSEFRQALMSALSQN